MAEDKDARLSIPIVEETAKVAKTTRTTATIRVSTKVEHDQQRLEDSLTVEEVGVERVAKGQWVDGPLPTRQEGETTVIPVVEEVAVVQKRFRLIEEVRITRHSRTQPFVQDVDVRRTRVAVERVEESPPGASPLSGPNP